jgi:MFS family permease
VNSSAQHRSRGRLTWTVFAALAAFGVLNAGLGPALPYLRAAEHLSYVQGVLLQVAFAVGGGVAGLLTARAGPGWPRAIVIRGGLLAAALCWLLVGYGGTLPVRVAAAGLVSLFGSAAVVRMWAVLADVHGPRRTVALAEGEVAVSLGGIVSPLLIGLMVGSPLGWRGAFGVAAALTGLAVALTAPVTVPQAPRQRAALPALDQPAPMPARRPVPAHRAGRTPGPPPALLIAAAVVALEFGIAFWLASYLTDAVHVGLDAAVASVSGLYVASLAGRLLVGRLARRFATATLLAGALLLAIAGLATLIAAGSAVVAEIGVAVAGTGIGAMFPLVSSLHVAATVGVADTAVGEVFAAASVGQLLGPLLVAPLAQLAGFRIAFLLLPGYALVAILALARHHRRTALP